MKPSAIFAAALVIIASGCGFGPEQVSFSDSRVQALLKATNAVNRASLGFTPIDSNSEIRLEWRARKRYDAMLHIYGKTQRTIAFRRKGDDFEWIGEQEIFPGVKEYDSPDGRLREEIIVNFEKEPVSGGPLNQVFIRYMGEDSSLARRANISLSEANGVLSSWGYK